jgi:hypothetical protein
MATILVLDVSPRSRRPDHRHLKQQTPAKKKKNTKEQNNNNNNNNNNREEEEKEAWEGGGEKNEYTPDNAVSAAADGTNRRYVLGGDFERIAEDVILRVLTIVCGHSRYTRSIVLRRFHGTISPSSSSSVVSFRPLRHSHR